MQTVCEVSSRDIELPSIVLLSDKAGGWVIKNFISQKRKKSSFSQAESHYFLSVASPWAYGEKKSCP